MRKRNDKGKRKKKTWVIICPAGRVYYAKPPKIHDTRVSFPRPFEKPKSSSRKRKRR
jgi:hypothetical protein